MQENVFALIDEKTGVTNLGSFATLSALESAISSVVLSMDTASIKPIYFSNSATFAPFTSSGGFSAFIQSRIAGGNFCFVTIWNQLGFMVYGFNNNGTYTWKKPTLT